MSFWENVELLREEQNTSYRWLAQIMGVSETTVSSMRRANTDNQNNDIYFKKYINLKKTLQNVLDTL